MRKRKQKKIKLPSLPKIRRKLLKLWSEIIRERDGFACCYCGIKHGSKNRNNSESKIKCDSHHLLQKEIANCPLKYEIKNGILLCSSDHKFNGEHSAHKSPIVFYDWFRKNYPDRYDFILNNSSIRVDLDNRLILTEIEKRLIAKESLDIDKLKEIEKQFPREIKKRKPKATLFDDDEKSSSSSESI